MKSSAIGVIGLGFAVPSKERFNSDPIFDFLKKSQFQSLFQGYKSRHVLTENETLVEIMALAAVRAMQDAGVKAADVDLLLGAASLSRWIVPTDLGALHSSLGLSPKAAILPLGNEFSNFTQGLILSDALLRVGRARTVLVVAGSDWTRAVDYHTPPAISAADGAAAAVLGGPLSLLGNGSPALVRWCVLDQAVLVDHTEFGGMYVAGDALRKADQPEDQQYSGPYFHMTDKGIRGFHDFGQVAAVRPAFDLLARQGLTGADITLIGHQASTTLSDAWVKAIQPAKFLTTMEDFANMTVASIGATFARLEAEIETDYVLLLALGLDMHAHVILIQRHKA